MSGLKLQIIWQEKKKKRFFSLLSSSRFRSEGMWGIHYQRRHLGIEPVKCQRCPVFAMPTRLEVHMRKAHGNREKLAKCSLCGARFRNKKLVAKKKRTIFFYSFSTEINFPFFSLQVDRHTQIIHLGQMSHKFPLY